LQAEFESCARELISLVQRINRTNATSRLDSGTLADALAERDVLKIRGAAHRELAAAASTTQARTTRSEVKFVSTVSVAAIQRKARTILQRNFASWIRESRKLIVRLIFLTETSW
jgi:hypothetical protein